MHDEEIHIIGDSENRNKRSMEEDEEDMRYSTPVDQTHYNSYDPR
jgi:hypothetical protein